MFKGSIVALATPFKEDGSLDVDAFAALVSWHVQEGSDAILVSGITGEGPTLTSEEREELVHTAVAVAKKRAPIIVGTGSCDTQAAIQETQKAKACGAEACLVTVPYYNKPTPEGCLAHFKAVAQVGMPIIPYHHPGRTAVRLPVKVLAEIARMDPVVAIKESTADLEYVFDLQQLTDVPLLCGDDALVVSFMAAGCKGVCSVMANLIPKEWKEMVHACLQGNFPFAMQQARLYYPLCKALFHEVNPQGIKYALSLLGKSSPFLRLPLLGPRAETKEMIRQALEKIVVIPKQSEESGFVCSNAP